MKKITSIVLALMVAAAMFCSVANAAKPKVLYVDSYHEGYAWSDGIAEGIATTLGDKAELQIYHMDTKRNAGDDFKQEAALKAKDMIEQWQPDVVIASDDNAAKFLISPYFKDSKIPFVFCGVNWDATPYGLPCTNVTGMLEVSIYEPLLKELRRDAKGDRIGLIAPDIITARKEEEKLKQSDPNIKCYYAKDYEDWKAGFQKMQDECDILLVDSDGGLYKDQKDDMLAFVRENTTVPTGACYDFMAPFVLLSYAKVAQEQGQWAADAALQIIDGKSPMDIPVTENKKGQMFVNMPIAKKLGVKVPLKLIKVAEVIKD